MRVHAPWGQESCALFPVSSWYEHNKYGLGDTAAFWMAFETESQSGLLTSTPGLYSNHLPFSCPCCSSSPCRGQRGSLRHKSVTFKITPSSKSSTLSIMSQVSPMAHMANVNGPRSLRYPPASSPHSLRLCQPPWPASESPQVVPAGRLCPCYFLCPGMFPWTSSRLAPSLPHGLTVSWPST